MSSNKFEKRNRNLTLSVLALGVLMVADPASAQEAKVPWGRSALLLGASSVGGVAAGGMITAGSLEDMGAISATATAESGSGKNHLQASVAVIPTVFGAQGKLSGTSHSSGLQDNSSSGIFGFGVPLDGGYILLGISANNRTVRDQNDSSEALQIRMPENLGLAFAFPFPGLEKLILSGQCIGGRMVIRESTRNIDLADGAGVDCSAIGEMRLGKNVGGFISAQNLRSQPFIADSRRELIQNQNLLASVAPKVSIGVSLGK